MTNEVHFVYDGNLVYQERDQNNNTLTTYTWGNDLSGTLQGASGIGGLLARSDKMQIIPLILSPLNPDPQWVNTAYYHSDGNGNVTSMIQPSGLPVAIYQYDPYGNLIEIGGLLANENKYRFSTKEWDDNADLYYYGHRFYDPNLQRWINRDPIQELGGINLYACDDNDPINLGDPAGNCPGAIAIAWGAAETTAAGAAAAATAWVTAAGAGGYALGTALDKYTPVGNIGHAVGNWMTPLRPTPKAGDQLSEIGKAQQKATRVRPNINDPNDEWDGMPRRPKQNTIRDVSKSQQRARSQDYKSDDSCTDDK